MKTLLNAIDLILDPASMAVRNNWQRPTLEDWYATGIIKGVIVLGLLFGMWTLTQ